MRRVIAMIRFSYLYADDTAYATAKGRSLDDRRAELFRPERMRERFAIFEHVCLPSLVSQPPESFGAVLLASELMPEHDRERLRSLLTPYPNLVVTFRGPEPPPFSEGFLEPLAQLDDVADVIMTCRLDDDDALSVDYTAAAETYVRPDHIGFCVSFPRGLQAANVDGEPRFWISEWPLVGAGLGRVQPRCCDSTIYDIGHHQRVWKRRPTIVDAAEPRYLVTLHRENDSTAAVRERRRGEPRTKTALRHLRDLALRRSSSRHDHQARNAPTEACSLAEARARFSGRFAPLDQGDWSFLAPRG